MCFFHADSVQHGNQTFLMTQSFKLVTMQLKTCLVSIGFLIAFAY